MEVDAKLVFAYTLVYLLDRCEIVPTEHCRQRDPCNAYNNGLRSHRSLRANRDKTLTDETGECIRGGVGREDRLEAADGG
jgi:hypothetical protein